MFLAGRSLFLSFLVLIPFVVEAAAAARVAPTLDSDAATLRGTVTDPDGRVVPAAQILLSGPVGVIASAESDPSGAFRFDGLQPGSYELRVSLPGFGAEPIRLTLGADEQREVAIRLRIAAIAETVVVSAAQVDVPLSRAPGSVDVIGAAELRARQIETLADALRLVPGLTVTRSGGRGGLTSLFPRGGESDFTLVLIDGVRANAFGGGYDFAHLPVAEVERIEVVRGPQSALFGSDAIGAVIQIVTRHGGRPRGEAALEAGSFGASRLTAGAAGSTGAWSWGGAAERLASDGFTGLAPATGERVSNDDDERWSASGSLGWRGGPDTIVRGDARVESNARGFPGPFGSNPVGAFQGVDRLSRGHNDTRHLALSATHPWRRAGRARQRTQAVYADLDGSFVSPYGVSESGTRRLSVRTQTDVAANANVGLSFGIEAQRERARSTYVTGATFQPIPVRRTTAGYFAESRYDGGGRFSLTMGLRAEQIRRDRLEEDPNPFVPRPVLPAGQVLSVNPKLAVAYHLRPAWLASGWTRLRASAGTGIRPPDAFEVAFTDNPSLRPERSRGLDAGIDQALAGGAVVVTATAFLNRYDDLIVAVGRSLRDASRYRTDNISNARARGLELSVAARASWGLDLRGAYTWLDTRILAVDGASGRAPAPFAPGDPLLRRPRHQGALDLAFARGRVSAYARVESRGRMLDVEPTFGAFGGLFPTPGYAVVHAGAAFQIGHGVEILARSANVLDRRYEETLGFPALGRSLMVGARIAARR